MKKCMPIGVDNYGEIIEKNYFYVDKTRFIKQLIDGHSKVTLITRPRRFGKTLTVRMVEYFFSMRYADRKDLFAGTDIERAGNKYMAERGKYPVIFMSLKGIKEDNYASAMGMLAMYIKNIFYQYEYLKDFDKLSDDEIEELHKIYQITEKDPMEGVLKRSIGLLVRLLHKYHDIKPIVLLDEYDAPIQASWSYNYYPKMINFMRGFMGDILKGNDSLNFAIVTGVLRVAKESIFSDLNNLDVCSVLSDKYSDIIGFTNEEIKLITEYWGVPEKFDEIKRWYDGYSFGKYDIYNPWSVIKYFGADCKPSAYWVNTSGNDILKELLAQEDDIRFKELNGLLEGKSVYTMIDEGIIYDEIGKNTAALYTMLLTTGYLTIDKTNTAGKFIDEDFLDMDQEEYALCIPNRELKNVFVKEILNNLGDGISHDKMRRMLRNMLNGNVEDFNKGLQEFITNIASSYDTGKNPEVFYHGLMLGLTALLRPGYVIESNRESGNGRFDIAIYPRNTKYAGVVLEFKKSERKGKLKVKAMEALQQIEENKYIASFNERGISTVWKYGIAFWKKDVIVFNGNTI